MQSIKRALLIVVGVALGVGALVFVSLNRHWVSVDLYFGALVEIPMWALVPVCMLVGWLVPRLLGVGTWFRLNRERSQLRRRIADLEREVVELRNIPLDLDDPLMRPPIKPTRAAPVQRVVEVVTERAPRLVEGRVEPDEPDKQPQSES